MTRSLGLALVLGTVTACSSGSASNGGDDASRPPIDAGRDATSHGPDAGRADATRDSSLDAGLDASSSGLVDGSVDTSSGNGDAARDSAPSDGASSSGPDGASDGEVYAFPDAGRELPDGAASCDPGLTIVVPPTTYRTPTPSILVMNTAGSYGAASPAVLTGEAPFQLHVSAIPQATDHPCFWDPTAWAALGEKNLCATAGSAAGLAASKACGVFGAASSLGNPVNVETGATLPCFTENQNDPATLELQHLIATCIRNRDIADDESAAQTLLGNGSVRGSTFGWDFGDTTAAAEFNTVPGPSAAHVYDAAGSYTITLRVTNEAGLTSAPVTVTVVATASTRVDTPITTSADLAALAAASPTGTTGRRIRFQRGATYAATGTIHLGSNDWVTSSLGDGGGATAALPVLTTNFGGPLFASANQGASSIVIEQVNAVAGSGRVTFSTVSGNGVVYRDLQFPGANLGFDIGGAGVLLSNVGVPVAADGTWQDNKLLANFLLATVSGLTLYGGSTYNAPGNGNGEPMVRFNAGELITLYDADIGGAAGVADTISFREPRNVYLGGSNVRGGNVDIQCSIGQNPQPGSLIDNAVIEDNVFDDVTLNIEAGAYDVTIRNNIFRMRPSGDPFITDFPMENTLEMTYAGADAYGLEPNWVTIETNTFIHQASSGKPFDDQGGAGENVELLDNLFLPGTATPLYIVAPNLSQFTRVVGNLYFVNAGGAISGVAGGANITSWNALTLANGSHVADEALTPSMTGFTDAGTDNVDFMPPSSAPYATSGVNLSPSGGMAGGDTTVDLAGHPRPAAGAGGWTPGALQAAGH